MEREGRGSKGQLLPDISKDLDYATELSILTEEVIDEVADALSHNNPNLHNLV